MRILILEDEPSMAALLEQLVKNLWPQARVRLAADAFSALESWTSEGADLALIDWELPGMKGIEVLKHIKRSANKTVCVMVTAHADRPSILSAGVNHVDAFIVKPFDIEQLKIRLTRVMAERSHTLSEDPRGESEIFEAFEDFFESQLSCGALGLPITPELVYAVKGIRHLSSDDIKGLLQRCKQEPALVLRVLSLANNDKSARGPEPIDTFASALRRIGLEGLFNLTVELSLLKGSALKHDWLRGKYLELQSHSLARSSIVKRLGGELGGDVEALRTACLLDRVGDLAVLQAMQAWVDLGQPLDQAGCDAMLKRVGLRAAARLYQQWPLPGRIRARVDALNELPEGKVDKELILLRAASLIHARDPEDQLGPLLARLGLPPGAGISVRGAHPKASTGD